MIKAVKDFAKRYWPALRLRTILLAVLLLVAAMPVAGALFLRVYENTLIRQTEAELVAQGAVLAAVATADWPGAPPQGPIDTRADGYYRPERTTIDLSATPILSERPAAMAGPPADPAAFAAVARMSPVIDRSVQTTLASVLVLDRQGVVVRGYGEGGSLAGLPEVATALGGSPRTVLRRNGDYRPRYSFEWLSRASAIRIHHARPIKVAGKTVGVLLLSRSPRALFRGLYEDRIKFGLGLVLTVGLLVVLAGLVSRGIARPIEALSRAAREVSAGRGTTPDTPVTAAIEIRALYDDFREMAAAIDRRSRYLRDFAAAISHEFKTPLAGIGGAAELLQDHFETMSPAERRRFLDNIAADNRRLSRLVTRLLDLARADMARPEAGVAADLAASLRRSVDLQGESGLEITLDLPADLPSVAVPEMTLETVMATLLENSRQAGARRVAISARRSEGQVLIAVQDDGPGVAEADRDRLFEPFFTSRRADGGTGLGLPIARSLLAASQGAIRWTASGAGARFEVRAPLA